MGMKHKKILITGGLGFIGGHFVQYMRTRHPLVSLLVVDKNTYAANPERIAPFLKEANFFYEEADIADAENTSRLFSNYAPDAVINFAAETHVDNSIQSPAPFLKANVTGTFQLLEAARKLWLQGPQKLKEQYAHARFYQISTDEVFGSLGTEGFFSEESKYAPNSPYSASKAAADHWVRSYFHTYGLPTLISQCSNNYGPYQHHEKLIPTIIRHAVLGKKIPLYGDGKNVRDWLFVEDHCSAIEAILARASAGATYTIGGNAESDNHALALRILKFLDEQHPRKDKKSYVEQIDFVSDRPGHDFRYAIDASKLRDEMQWQPKHSLSEGLAKTILHYLNKTNQ